MQVVVSVVIQALLLGLALAVTILRCWIRLHVEHRRLTIADYLIWGGWICTLGWSVCSIKALYILIDHPPDEEAMTDSVDYLKLTGASSQTVFLSCYFFDTGLYFPKASLVAFYWWLIPWGFRGLRISVYVTAAFIGCAWMASLLADTFIAPSISDNWSLENQLNSIWNSYTNLTVNWTLNIGTDLILFCLPFFLINCLKLHRRQKIGLAGVFSLGVITMAISLARFVVYSMDYNVSEAIGNAWCTAEMCTAVIVVSLPSLKSFIARTTPAHTANRSNTGYIQTGSGKPVSSSRGGTYTSHIQDGTVDHEEMELTFLDRRASPTPTGTTDETRTQDGKDNVMVTTNVTVTRDVL
ncbi:uncharacterized protein ALTATR162_LOCUS159 [Alternaria atra]|uniref:Rhodopsin domain-containing protein n=1 Tax=Alternaria atra TaxID=119953 RepID=A0A8J2HTD3_9PLEO|nr:uncharacterized protein ALTATR162_LOCUS159 [Alternaria atra]CAG5137584.1 unnamed protein product [Alternaria atra]